MKTQLRTYPVSVKAALHGCVTFCVAFGVVGLLAASKGLDWWTPYAAGSVGIATLLAAEPVRRSHPPKQFGPANRVTMTRAVFVGIVAAFVGSDGTNDHSTWVTIAAALALILDGVDGAVARKTRTTSEYGGQLDMELDSILMMLLSVLAWQWDRAGVWVLFCGLARYLWVATQTLLPWFRRTLPPAFRRKTACVIGVGGLTGSLAPWPWPGIDLALSLIATITLAISFAIDAAWIVKHRTESLP
jgi:phosphatidylglycerophosphate synthase